MNQGKIGKFIAKKRKENNITQLELSEKLGVTDRAVSNWKNGKNMPDLSLLNPLCYIFGITINELISGEEINNKEYNEKLEENFINTIDYIDKKNEKTIFLKSIFLLIVGILGIFLSQYIFVDNEVSNYLTVICMILGVYIVKDLFIKYKLARRITAIIIVILCFISLFSK